MALSSFGVAANDHGLGVDAVRPTLRGRDKRRTDAKTARRGPWKAIGTEGNRTPFFGRTIPTVPIILKNGPSAHGAAVRPDAWKALVLCWPWT